MAFYSEKVISFLLVFYQRYFERPLIESLDYGFAVELISLEGVQACSYWSQGGLVFLNEGCCFDSLKVVEALE